MLIQIKEKIHFDLVNDQMTMVSEELNVVNEVKFTIRYGEHE